MLLELRIDGFRHDTDLQLVQADVFFAVGGEVLVDEAVCIDVGLPALLASALRDSEPDRFAPAERWERIPFFICGCGDPECRAHSFVVRHMDAETVRIMEVEERHNAPYRKLGIYDAPRRMYQEQSAEAGRRFLTFVLDRDYRPYFGDTLKVVRRLLGELEQALHE